VVNLVDAWGSWEKLMSLTNDPDPGIEGSAGAELDACQIIVVSPPASRLTELDELRQSKSRGNHRKTALANKYIIKQ
jgi:hypothetical protein